MAFSAVMSRTTTTAATASAQRSARRQLRVSAAAMPDGGNKLQHRAAQAAGLLAAVQLFSAGAAMPPTLAAGLDTNTFKAGTGAKVEASDISNERPAEVVRKLQDEVLPRVREALTNAANKSGDRYDDSVVQELGVVQEEINALVKEVAGGKFEPSNVLSAASGIEQQVNALKAILGYD